MTSISAKDDERTEAFILLDRLNTNEMKDTYRMSICEADKGYDSDDLRQKMFNKGYFPFIGCRKNRKTSISSK